jgi:type IV secretory pathway VirB10-like protein
MSRYAYGYSVAPARPTGWRSAFGNFIGVSAVVTLSVISGAVVAYELIGGDVRFLSTSVSSTAVAPAAATTGAAPGIQPTPTLAAVESPKPAPRLEAPAVVATVTPAPVAAPQAAPAVPAPSAPIARNEEAAPPARDDLTFAKGYALRRAARQAAAQAATPKAAVQTATANSKVAAAADSPGAAVEMQFGRPAAAAKRKSNAMAQYPRNERYGMFERFEGPRHQAMAFGDSSSSRPVRRSSGWFDSLF